MKRSWLGLVGPAAAGKSTLARALVVVPGVYVVPEPVPEDEELEQATDVRAVSAGAGYRLQAAYLRAKRRAFEAGPANRLLVFDRTVAEDRAVFFAVHRHLLGTLDDDEVALLTAEATSLETTLGDPVAVIELGADIDVLRRRLVEATDRPAWLVSTLADQIRLYSEWLARHVGPRLVVRTDVATPEVTLQVCGELVARLAAGEDPGEEIRRAAAQGGAGFATNGG